jgi:hypothetical protein
MMDAAQMSHRYMGIDLGGVHSRVPQKRLDRPQVGSVIQHVGRTGMAQKMGPALCQHAGRREITAHDLPPCRGGEAIAVGSEKHYGAGRIRHDLQGARLGKIAFQPVLGGAAKRHDSFLSTFAISNNERSVAPDEVTDRKAHQFAPAKARGVGHLHHRPVPQSQRIIGVGLFQHSENLRLVQDRWNAASMAAPEACAGHRIGINAPVQVQITKKRVYGADHALFAGVGVLGAFPRAVLVEPGEPSLQQAPGNPLWPGHMTAPTPLEKKADVDAPTLDACGTQAASPLVTEPVLECFAQRRLEEFTGFSALETTLVVPPLPHLLASFPTFRVLVHKPSLSTTITYSGFSCQPWDFRQIKSAWA